MIKIRSNRLFCFYFLQIKKNIYIKFVIYIYICFYFIKIFLFYLTFNISMNIYYILEISWENIKNWIHKIHIIDIYINIYLSTLRFNW